MNKIELTRFEMECREVLRDVQDRLSPGRPKSESPTKDWYEVLVSIKRAIDHLDYRENGCPMGLHWGDCTCEEDKAGQSYQYIKAKTKKLIKMNKGKGSE